MCIVGSHERLLSEIVSKEIVFAERIEALNGFRLWSASPPFRKPLPIQAQVRQSTSGTDFLQVSTETVIARLFLMAHAAGN